MIAGIKRLSFVLATAVIAACSSGGGSVGPPPPQPISVDGLAGTAPTGTTVSLTWNGHGPFTGFRIYRDSVQIATSAAESFTDTGRTPSTNYTYFVRAEQGSTLSAPSATVSVTTPNMLTLTLAKLADPASRSYIMIRDVEFDAAGNVYLAGGAFSSNFPTTPGAYDRTFASGGSSPGNQGPVDAFVMKFTRAGTLVWSTRQAGKQPRRFVAIMAVVAADPAFGGRKVGRTALA